jgi:hypothetical protein
VAARGCSALRRRAGRVRADGGRRSAADRDTRGGRADPALHVGVRVWCPDGCADDPDSVVPKKRVEGGWELGVAIVITNHTCRWRSPSSISRLRACCGIQPVFGLLVHAKYSYFRSQHPHSRRLACACAAARHAVVARLPAARRMASRSSPALLYRSTQSGCSDSTYLSISIGSRRIEPQSAMPVQERRARVRVARSGRRAREACFDRLDLRPFCVVARSRCGPARRGQKRLETVTRERPSGPLSPVSARPEQPFV